MEFTKSLEFLMQCPQTFYYGMTTVYYGEFNVWFWEVIEPSTYHGLHGMQWNIMEHCGIQWNIMERNGISWNMMEYQ